MANMALVIGPSPGRCGPCACPAVEATLSPMRGTRCQLRRGGGVAKVRRQ
jgi:hypothetical protein